jgi:C1A family cysteine protease
MKRNYGWMPDVPDARDYLYMAVAPPKQSDLRGEFPLPPYDQGSLGACVENAGAGAWQFSEHKQRRIAWIPSRLFWYYNVRKAQGTINSDSGSTIRQAMKVVCKAGVCPETDWPYVESNWAVKPTQRATKDAASHVGDQYFRVDRSLLGMGGCLSDGYPFLAGISVYESFESDAVTKTGIVPLPELTEKLLGGHAALVCGWDPHKQFWIVRNSWGTEWGDQGYFYLPETYLLNPNLADDFWTIRRIK